MCPRRALRDSATHKFPYDGPGGPGGGGGIYRLGTRGAEAPRACHRVDREARASVMGRCRTHFTRSVINRNQC